MPRPRCPKRCNAVTIRKNSASGADSDNGSYNKKGTVCKDSSLHVYGRGKRPVPLFQICRTITAGSPVRDLHAGDRYLRSRYVYRNVIIRAGIQFGNILDCDILIRSPVERTIECQRSCSFGKDQCRNGIRTRKVSSRTDHRQEISIVETPGVPLTTSDERLGALNG